MPLCFLFLSLAVSSAWAVDPSKHISQYAHTAWRLQDGAFNGVPRAIVQTTDGYIWIGTTSGLLRFDGVRFVPWSVLNEQQVLASSVTALLASRDGSLWIGSEVSRTQASLSRWVNQHLINYVIQPGHINSIIEDHNGAFWITQRTEPGVSDTPLCQIIAVGTRCYGKADGFPELTSGASLVEDREGNLWTGDSTALVRWRSGLGTVYKPSGLRSNAGMDGINALAPAPDGSLWVGIVAGPGLGLQQLVKGVLKPFVRSGLVGSTLGVSALLLDRHNALWIGTYDHGLYRVYGDNVDHFTRADGLSGDNVFRFCEDREGNLWVATSGGIDNFRDLRVATFSTREGISTNEVDTVFASRDGTLWAGGANVLAAIRHDRASSIDLRKHGQETQVTSIFEDHAGQLMVGIDNTLSIYQNAKFTQIRTRDGKLMGMSYGITEDVGHNIWVETRRTPWTLFRIQGGKIEEEFRAPQMPAARRVAADADNSIWLGLNSGDLARYRNGRTEIFRFEHKLNSSVDQVSVNPDGSVYGATAFGLVGWTNGKRQILGARNGLPCDTVYTFVSDHHGALWLYMKCGLVEITNAEMQKWWEHPEAMVKSRVFDALDGVQPGSVPFGGAARSTDGRLWFANGFAVQMINPENLAQNALPPPVHIEGIVADRKSYSYRAGLRLPPLTRDLEIDYTALSFVVPQRVLFRYKLEGRDTGWQEAGTRRQAYYTDLRPGTYRFRVIACNNDGVWNEEGAILNFTVAPAWFQTKSFLVVCIVSASFVAWVLYRMRMRQVAMAMSTRFDERLAERTRMARELHDTFLQTIHGSKLVVEDALEKSDDPARMKRSLEQLADWLDRAVDEGRAALNSLRVSTTQRNDLAEAFRRATEECRMQRPIEASFAVVGNAREMHPVVRDEIYRIGYEAVRNACMHSRCSRLEVGLRYTQDIALRVSDNGIGIDPLVADQGKDGHFGLPGMRERTARIGGKLTIVSSANSGTEITVVVPGSIVFRKSRTTPSEKIKAILRRMGTTSNPN